MRLRFKNPNYADVAVAKPKPHAKNQWHPFEVPAGPLSDILKAFREASEISLKELYTASQLAVPISQAEVDSVLAPMATLVEQEIQAKRVACQIALAELGELLEELDMTGPQMERCREAMEAQPCQPEPAALQSPKGKPSLPASSDSEAKTVQENAPETRGGDEPVQVETESAQSAGTGLDLRYNGGLPRGTAAREDGGR